jgi:hypothetical protein
MNELDKEREKGQIRCHRNEVYLAWRGSYKNWSKYMGVGKFDP